mmetsp:Transcript_58646/g.139650  ORF Transcript_58646/g.139650 Transcript_58646/m.139650 type:complete len:399 (-) Transcript_58646:8-1204(-)
MEGPSLHVLLTLALAVRIPHTPALLLPDQVTWRVPDHPGTICPAGADTATAVSNHAIQAEELGVVVVQVVQLVLHLVEKLRALCETHVRVQLHFFIEEVRDGRVEEIGLELMAGIANAVEARVVVPLIVVHVLRFVRVEAQVVLCKVQAPRFSAAGPERHVVHEGVVVLQAVDHLPGVGAKPQPVLVLRILGHLVVPRSRCHVLGLDGALVLHGLGARQVVQPQRQAVAVLGLPVCHVVPVQVLLLLLVVLAGLLLGGLLHGLRLLDLRKHRRLRDEVAELWLEPLDNLAGIHVLVFVLQLGYLLPLGRALLFVVFASQLVRFRLQLGDPCLNLFLISLGRRAVVLSTGGLRGFQQLHAHFCLQFERPTLYSAIDGGHVEHKARQSGQQRSTATTTMA